MLRRLLMAFVLLVALAAVAVYWFLSGDRVRSALEGQATAWLGHPVRISRASVSFFPRVGLRLEDVRVGEPVRLTLARVELSTGIRPLFSRRIEDAEVVVSDSRVDMPLPFQMPARSTSALAAGQRAGVLPVTEVELVSIRSITLRDVVLRSRGLEIAVSADSALAGNRLVITSFTGRAGETALTASGSVELWPRVVATMKAEANRLDFDDLLALAAGFMPTAAETDTGETQRPAQLDLTITAPHARLAGVALTRFEATLSGEGPDVRIEPLRFDVFGGRFDGWLDIAFGDALGVRVGMGVSNLDVAQLAEFGGIPDTITGRLYGSGRFGARSRDMTAVLRAARGVGEVAISDGTIRHLDVVRTVVLFFGRPAADAPPAEGERFTELTANFALAEQSVRSDDLTLRSPDFDVFARGSLALPTKSLDARGELVLSEALSAQAGSDLYRFTRSGTRVVLPVVVSGSLKEPRVRIDAGAAARRGLRNEIERRLQDLFERIKPSVR